MVRVTLPAFAVELATVDDALAFLVGVGLLGEEAEPPQLRRETGPSSPPGQRPMPRAEPRAASAQDAMVCTFCKHTLREHASQLPFKCEAAKCFCSGFDVDTLHRRAEPRAAPAPLSFAELAEREKRRQNGSFVPARAEAELEGELARMEAEERIVNYAAPVTVDGCELVARLCAKCGRQASADVKRSLDIAAERVAVVCLRCRAGLTHDMPETVRAKHLALCPDACPGHWDEELHS